MDRERRIKVLTDYTEYPGPRYINQAKESGSSSGEDFYIKILNPVMAECIRDGMKLTVDLDDTSGYPSSFLDESFGQLVYDFMLANVKNIVTIISSHKKWVKMIVEETYPQWEVRRLRKDEPKVSEPCEVWHLDINGQLEKTKRQRCL